jgi:hypothetical protein
VPELRLENWRLYDESASGRLFWSKFDPEGLWEWRDVPDYVVGVAQGWVEGNIGKPGPAPSSTARAVGIQGGRNLAAGQAAFEICNGGSNVIGGGSKMGVGVGLSATGAGTAAGGPEFAAGAGQAAFGALEVGHGLWVASNVAKLPPVTVIAKSGGSGDGENPSGPSAKKTTEESQAKVDGETGNGGMQDGYDPDDLKGLTVKEGKEQGRDWRVEKLETYEFDPKQPSNVRGWLKNERRRTEQGRQEGARNPPGYEQAHKPGKPAREGYDYNSSDLNLKSNNDLAKKHGL